MTDEPTSQDASPSADQMDLEKYLEQREKMESLFAEKFTRTLTVMFTDLKGSTAIAESQGDLVSRTLIKDHNAIVFPAVKENNGVFIKSIGDGTLSYFEQALDAVRAAARIQQGMDALNMSKKFKTPVLMRIGMHTGRCVVEQNDIFGDVVNTASRFESAAHPGEIYISEDTYNALSDKSEIYCRFAEQVMLKGKKEPFNAYKAFWNPQEIELDKQDKAAPPPQPAAPAVSPMNKLTMIGVALAAVVLVVIVGSKFFGSSQPVEDRRSISHSLSAPEGAGLRK
ncbi:MAG TPA: adenylate/guanylate cyclase domain-containing protein [Noviherbaspirillum sp.]|nr:adenylate/guanylate cyclase domain-containing protein [Noviherbaspirillum sp.]